MQHSGRNVNYHAVFPGYLVLSLVPFSAFVLVRIALALAQTIDSQFWVPGALSIIDYVVIACRVWSATMLSAGIGGLVVSRAARRSAACWIGLAISLISLWVMTA